MQIPKRSRRLVHAYENLGYEVLDVDDKGMIALQGLEQRIYIREGVSMLNRDPNTSHILSTGMPFHNGKALGQVVDGVFHPHRTGELTAREKLL